MRFEGELDRVSGDDADPWMRWWARDRARPARANLPIRATAVPASTRNKEPHPEGASKSTCSYCYSRMFCSSHREHLLFHSRRLPRDPQIRSRKKKVSFPGASLCKQMIIQKPDPKDRKPNQIPRSHRYALIVFPNRTPQQDAKRKRKKGRSKHGTWIMGQQE